MPTRLTPGLAPAWLDVACAQHVGLSAANKRRYVTSRNMGVSQSCVVGMSLLMSSFLAFKRERPPRYGTRQLKIDRHRQNRVATPPFARPTYPQTHQNSRCATEACWSKLPSRPWCMRAVISKVNIRRNPRLFGPVGRLYEEERAVGTRCGSEPQCAWISFFLRRKAVCAAAPSELGCKPRRRSACSRMRAHGSSAISVSREAVAMGQDGNQMETSFRWALFPSHASF